MSDYPADYADLPTGARLHYIDTGTPPDANVKDAPPIIALHGMVGIPQDELRNVIDWLKPRYRVIAPSFRGYGKSTPKPRTFPPNFYYIDADDIAALMNILGIKQAHIMGYSDGGEVALILAGKYPERIKSVAAWGAVGYYGPAMRAAAQRAYPGEWISDALCHAHGIDDRAHFTLQWVQAVRFIIDSGGDLSVSLVENCPAPILMMLGKKDTLNPTEYAQKVVEHAPNARLEMFDCGHGVHTGAEAEFKRVVGAFLQESAPSG